LDVNGQRDLLRESNGSRAMPIAVASSVSTSAPPTNPSQVGKNDKIDPYYIIIHVSISFAQSLLNLNTFLVESP